MSVLTNSIIFNTLIEYRREIYKDIRTKGIAESLQRMEIGDKILDALLMWSQLNIRAGKEVRM